MLKKNTHISMCVFYYIKSILKLKIKYLFKTIKVKIIKRYYT